ncbi:MAG: hypothetical protein Q4C04_00115 [Clostridia bacterium]|nr:hypothetical protein [Clostridia bacterium]
MISYTLYDLALEFKKAKLWMELYDTQLFAVRHSDGTIGYCCVMGRMGEHFALAVYPGDTGLDAYRAMGHDRSKMDYIEQHENALLQDCVMVSFQNKRELLEQEIDEVTAYMHARGLTLRGRKAYPQFERFRPHHYPWRLDDENDRTHLKEAMEAALEVSERLEEMAPEELGFTEGAPYDRSIPLIERENGAFVWKTIALGPPRKPVYPSPEITDDIALAKLGQCNKKGGVWACDIFMHLEAISDEEAVGNIVENPISAPYFPYLLLIVNNESGKMLGVEVVKELSDEAALISSVINTAMSTGKPEKIFVLNDRAKAFFKKLAPQLGATLAKRKRLPLLEEARYGLTELFGDQEEAAEEFDDLMAMLSDPNEYACMPDETLAVLRQMSANTVLPPEVAQLIERECKKRGM